MAKDWTPTSWRSFPIKQQPLWPDEADLERALKQIAGYPPLVFAGEARSLQPGLAQVAAGNAFLLQAGDCAESFEDFSADNIREKLPRDPPDGDHAHLLDGCPRDEGRSARRPFAKPRSADYERIGDTDIPSFRGHIVNAEGTSATARVPRPSGSCRPTTNLPPRSTSCGRSPRAGSQALDQRARLEPGVRRFQPAGQRYDQLAEEIDRALRFIRATGMDTEDANLRQVDVWTSHEALLLSYEEALTRQDSTTGHWYDCSAHMLWIGERTRELDGAHVEFLRGVGNPIGCKVGQVDDRRGGDRSVRSDQPGPDPRAPHPDHQDGCRPDRGRATSSAAGGQGQRPPGGLGVRFDARQHLHQRRRTQDPRLRVDRRRDRGLRTSPPRRGHVAGRPHRAHRRGRHRVHRRRRPADRRRPRPPVPNRSATLGSTAGSHSSWHSAPPS